MDITRPMLNRRCPPSVRVQGIFPAASHRWTVIMEPPAILATNLHPDHNRHYSILIEMLTLIPWIIHVFAYIVQN